MTSASECPLSFLASQEAFKLEDGRTLVYKQPEVRQSCSEVSTGALHMGPIGCL